MMIFAVILAISTVFAVVTAHSGPPHGKIVSCFVSVQSSQEELESEFSLENVDLNLCTHLIYIDRSSLKGEDPWDSADASNVYWRNDEYKKLTDLRQKYAHLKVCLFIDHLQPNFYIMTTKQRSRQRYIQNAIKFLLEHQFNGMDLNWRSLGDKFDDAFVVLVKELKEEMEKHQLILSGSFSDEKDELAKDHRFASMSKHLDFMHFTMIYESNRDQPDKAVKLYGIANLKYLIKTVIQSGIQSTKIVMGLKLGGLDYDSVSGITTDLGYDQMCNEFANDKKKRWSKRYDASSNLMVARQLDEFIPFYRRTFVFESTRSIANRIRYAVENNLGGAAAIIINSDDLSGKCGIDKDTYASFKIGDGNLTLQERNDGKFPLLQTINDAIVVTSDEMFEYTQFQLE